MSEKTVLYVKKKDRLTLIMATDKKVYWQSSDGKKSQKFSAEKEAMKAYTDNTLIFS